MMMLAKRFLMSSWSAEGGREMQKLVSAVVIATVLVAPVFLFS